MKISLTLHSLDERSRIGSIKETDYTELSQVIKKWGKDKCIKIDGNLYVFEEDLVLKYEEKKA